MCFHIKISFQDLLYFFRKTQNNFQADAGKRVSTYIHKPVLEI